VLAGCGGGGGGGNGVTAEGFVEEHPFFTVDPADPSNLVLASGEYTIEETLVLPEGAGLTIEAGTVLRFAADRSLLAYGPVLARGTSEAPIVFGAADPDAPWGIVAVIEGGQAVFEHLLVESASSITVDGEEIPGGLSVIGGSVTLTDSEFTAMHGKDGVYVRDGEVVIRGNTIRDTERDCLDLDGGAGEITANEFLGCGDEAIDLSDNDDLRVFGNTIVVESGAGIAADVNLDEIAKSNTIRHSERES
jgi:hypothetical protein